MQTQALKADDAQEAVLNQVAQVREAYKAVGYLGGPTWTTAGEGGLSTRTRSVSESLEALAVDMTAALADIEAIWGQESVSADPRPLDAERLARLREVARAEGADMSAWYAKMLDETD